jgi:peptidoglycan/LPS O-acetylase OafA/YrhL
LRYAYAWPVRGAILVGLAYLAWTNVEFNELTILLSSTLFLGLILNVATDPRVGNRLESPWVEKLGRISYGVYMYHFPLLYLALVALRSAGIPEGPTYTALLYAVTIFGTLLLAAASYRWVEAPFLRRKEQFAVVPSRA